MEIVPEPDAQSISHHRDPQEAGRPINATLKIEPNFPKDAPKMFYANVPRGRPGQNAAEIERAPVVNPSDLPAPRLGFSSGDRPGDLLPKRRVVAPAADRCRPGERGASERLGRCGPLDRCATGGGVRPTAMSRERCS